MRTSRSRARRPRSNRASTAPANSVATTAIGTAPRPQAIPRPIITNITAASRVSLMPERKRMNPPSPTSPNARAVLWPMTTTMSAPAIAISVWAWADLARGRQRVRQQAPPGAKSQERAQQRGDQHPQQHHLEPRGGHACRAPACR